MIFVFVNRVCKVEGIQGLKSSLSGFGKWSQIRGSSTGSISALRKWGFGIEVSPEPAEQENSPQAGQRILRAAIRGTTRNPARQH